MARIHGKPKTQAAPLLLRGVQQLAAKIFLDGHFAPSVAQRLVLSRPKLSRVIGTPVVILHGTGATNGAVWLGLYSAGNEVRSLQIDSFRRGRHVNGPTLSAPRASIILRRECGDKLGSAGGYTVFPNVESRV